MIKEKRNINNHFSKVAPLYRNLRTTDREPIHYIKTRLKALKKLKVLDVGCGTGRYDIELFKIFDNRLYLFCLDANKNMLAELKRNLENNKIKSSRYRLILSSASTLPFRENSLDVIFTFNAIHHFDLEKFLKECERSIKNKGFIFIYTRLTSQNKKSIWGRYFPEFILKEKRLYNLGDLKRIIKKVPLLKIEKVIKFRYPRLSSLERLIFQVKNRHYSTFYFYKKDEFKKAISLFKKRLIQKFKNTERITWYDENTMLVLRKDSSLSSKR